MTALHFLHPHSITGRWTEWRDVQAEFSGRKLTDPVAAFVNSRDLIWSFTSGQTSSRFVVEILAVIVAFVVLAIVVIRREWPEAVYTGVTIGVLMTSNFYYSVPRALALILPLWLLLGMWLTKSWWLRWVYRGASAPLLVAVTVRFSQRQMIGEIADASLA